MQKNESAQKQAKGQRRKQLRTKTEQIYGKKVKKTTAKAEAKKNSTRVRLRSYNPIMEYDNVRWCSPACVVYWAVHCVAVR